MSFVFLWTFVVSAVSPLDCQQDRSEIDSQRTAWVAEVLNATQALKVGMRRSDLAKLFTTEGGLSTTSQRTYVYRQCHYIKIDVKFAASRRDEELPTDRIVEISRPYLDWVVMD